MNRSLPARADRLSQSVPSGGPLYFTTPIVEKTAAEEVSCPHSANGRLCQPFSFTGPPVGLSSEENSMSVPPGTW
jgi:hypothetical protein